MNINGVLFNLTIET